MAIDAYVGYSRYRTLELRSGTITTPVRDIHWYKWQGASRVVAEGSLEAMIAARRLLIGYDMDAPTISY